MKTSHVILGIGVVLATAGTIMYLRKRKADQEDSVENKAVGAVGMHYTRKKRGSLTPMKASLQTFKCTDEDGTVTTLETDDYNEYSAFKNNCKGKGGTFTGTFTGRRYSTIATPRRTLRATGKQCACGCN